MFDILMALTFLILITGRCMVSLSIRSADSPELTSHDIDG